MGHQVQQDGNWNIEPAQFDWYCTFVLICGLMQEWIQPPGQARWNIPKPLAGHTQQTPTLPVSDLLPAFGHHMDEQQLSPHGVEGVIARSGIEEGAPTIQSQIQSPH